MVKRMIFIGMVTLIAASTASAFVAGGYIPLAAWAGQNPNSQQQLYAGYGGQIGAQVGPGYSAGNIGAGFSNTQSQSTPAGTGTQTTTVGNTQSAYISSYPNSAGVTYSDFIFGTYQGQFFLY